MRRVLKKIWQIASNIDLFGAWIFNNGCFSQLPIRPSFFSSSNQIPFQSHTREEEWTDEEESAEEEIGIFIFQNTFGSNRMVMAPPVKCDQRKEEKKSVLRFINVNAHAAYNLFRWCYSVEHKANWNVSPFGVCVYMRIDNRGIMWIRFSKSILSQRRKIIFLNISIHPISKHALPTPTPTPTPDSYRNSCVTPECQTQWQTYLP